jgi:Family of unknown function (DUF6196)
LQDKTGIPLVDALGELLTQLCIFPSFDRTLWSVTRLVSISQETVQQTDVRLKQVFRETECQWLPGRYGFDECPFIPGQPVLMRPEALALVRDDAMVSQLVPLDADAHPGVESFALWRCHFPAGRDNSGFVGWLATQLKQALGTGVLVVCGQNSQQGGIFDYWGVPSALQSQTAALLARLQD